MSTKLEDLQPNAAAAARLALADLDAQGFAWAVTSTLRTALEQAALYAQGRESLVAVNQKRRAAGLGPIGSAENTYRVTNCDGYTTLSNHQSGRALDVVPREGARAVWPIKSDSRWLTIAAVFEAHGFTWGGRWTSFPDYPHYEYKE